MKVRPTRRRTFFLLAFAVPTLVLGLLIYLRPAADWKADYDRLQVGMSHEEVYAILSPTMMYLGATATPADVWIELKEGGSMPSTKIGVVYDDRSHLRRKFVYLPYFWDVLEHWENKFDRH